MLSDRWSPGVQVQVQGQELSGWRRRRREWTVDRRWIDGGGGPRTGGGGLWENFFKQLAVNQTQRRGKERRFLRRHFLDAVHERLGVLLGEVSAEELDLHIHNRFVTGI